MKFLKYFESSEDDLGFDIDELKYYFTDLEDIGCTVRLRTSTKLIQSKSSDLTHFDFNMVIFIKVYIMPTRENQLRIFMMSDLFNEVIDVAKDRLSDKNLFIDDDSIKIDGANITLNIYKNEDMDKIKKS